MRVELIIIENDAELAEAMKLLDVFLSMADGAGAVMLRAQAKLIEDYERRRWPSRVPSVQQLVEYRADQHGMAPVDV